EALDVGDDLRALDGEFKTLGRLAGPFDKALGLLQRPERGIDLDAGQVAAGIVELFFLDEPFWEECPAPGGKDPAGSACADDSSGAHHVLPGAQSLAEGG